MHERLSKQQKQIIYSKNVRIIETLEPFLLLTLGPIKFSQISFPLVGVGRGGTKKPASRQKKRLLRCQTKGGKILPRG